MGGRESRLQVCFFLLYNILYCVSQKKVLHFWIGILKKRQKNPFFAEKWWKMISSISILFKKNIYLKSGSSFWSTWYKNAQDCAKNISNIQVASLFCKLKACSFGTSFFRHRSVLSCHFEYRNVDSPFHVNYLILYLYKNMFL